MVIIDSSDETLFEHPTIVEDIPETILLKFDPIYSNYIDVYYYWEHDLFNRFYVQNQTFLYENRFFEKKSGLDLGGRELKVSLVVYTPFSYANFGVSIKNIFFCGKEKLF